MKVITLRDFVKIIVGFLLIGVLLFFPAGTIFFWNGWLFFGVVILPMLLFGVMLHKKSPELLEKRLDTKEKLNSQKWVIGASGLMFLSGFLCSGFCYRYAWGRVSGSISVIASVLYVGFYLLYLEVMWENPYLFRTVTVCENQHVVDTGLYCVVRHPMYMVTLFLFLLMPFMLGSWVAFFIFLWYPVIIIFRITEEEKYLLEHLKGYSDYQKRVKYRLLPFIW